jgi:hypothetical protein
LMNEDESRDMIPVDGRHVPLVRGSDRATEASPT